MWSPRCARSRSLAGRVAPDKASGYQSPSVRISRPRRLMAVRSEGRHAHRDDRPLGAGQGPDRDQELVGACPIDDPQDRLAALCEPDRPLTAILRLRLTLDEPPAHQAVDQPTRGRWRPADCLCDVTDRHRAGIGEHVQRSELGEAKTHSPSWPAKPITSSRHRARPIATRSLIWRTFGSRLPAATTAGDRSSSNDGPSSGLVPLGAGMWVLPSVSVGRAAYPWRRERELPHEGLQWPG